MSEDAVPPMAEAGCGGGEVFALQVLGQSMAPEFADGDIVIVEPEGAVHDGSYVLARIGDEWIFRQLRSTAQGWSLHALNPAWPDQPLPGLGAVHGVILQKSVPGRRRLAKRYV